MQIIQTSSGPGVLCDDGMVVMPSDSDGLKALLTTAPDAVALLAAALRDRVDAAKDLVDEIVALNPISQENINSVYASGNSRIMLGNIAIALADKAMSEQKAFGGHDHE